MAAYPQLQSWLVDRMAAEGLNRAEVARAVGRHGSTVGRWLDGESRPDPASCDKLAELFHVDQDVVLTLARYRTDVDEIPVDDPRRRLHALVDRIDWGERDVWLIEGMLERLAKGGPGA